MDRRDQFAMAALPMVIDLFRANPLEYNQIALRAYSIADHMLKVRSLRGSEEDATKRSAIEALTYMETRRFYLCSLNRLEEANNIQHRYPDIFDNALWKTKDGKEIFGLKLLVPYKDAWSRLRGEEC